VGDPSSPTESQLPARFHRNRRGTRSISRPRSKSNSYFDDLLESAAAAVTQAAKIGDGKLFILEVERAVRIRTEARNKQRFSSA
jgi:hypothetical protein